MSAAQQNAIGEMIDAASDKIAQKIVAGLEERVKSLEAALETYQKQNRMFFAARDMALLEKQAERDAALMNQLTAFMKDTVKTEIQATENNITIQMADMQGAIEQIRDKDMELSSDDGLYSEDEAEEEAEGEESGAWSYEQVEALCLSRGAGEDEKQALHQQAVARAGREGTFDEDELQAVLTVRAEREQERQWALAGSQRALVQMGSPVAVDDLVASAQKLADRMTAEKFAQVRQDAKEQEAMMKMLERGQLTTAEYERTLKQKGKKREVDLTTLHRVAKAGKQAKKSLTSLTSLTSHPYRK